MKPQRIALFGLFGQGNLGNECTLQALTANIRERLPDADLFLVCTDPEEATPLHQLPSLPFDALYTASSEGASTRERGTLERLLRGVFRRIPLELWDWVRAYRALRGTRLMLMTGTGMLTDWCSSAFGYPYNIFKWTLVAKLRGCQVRFVSVGVGTLDQRLSRFFIKSALRLADYRCFRDEYSREKMKKLGYDSSGDSVYPDLAFSLPESLFVSPETKRVEKPEVGVGIMDYFGPRGHPVDGRHYYDAYMDRSADFVAWLLDHDYSVRILHGDMRYDQDARAELKRRVEQRGHSYEQAGVTDRDLASVEDLIEELAATDLVVSPRFHNLLLGLLLRKPVISISYDPKNDALLEGVGMENYGQSIDELDGEKLISQFREIEASGFSCDDAVGAWTGNYRHQLDEQYKRILAPFLLSPDQECVSATDPIGECEPICPG